MYSERTYRQLHRQDDLVHFQVKVAETDLDIGVRREVHTTEMMGWCKELVVSCRRTLEEYIKGDSVFASTLSPHRALPGAPEIARTMCHAGAAAGVGPMAAVAGTIAQHVGKELIRRSRDVIVENGGDIFLKSRRIRHIGIFAGTSVLSHRLALEIRPEDTPLGICTSSGTVGHSLSFGVADAVIILSPDTPLADAVATAAGNMVNCQEDMEKAVNFATAISGITGAIIILGDKLAARGRVKLLPRA